MFDALDVGIVVLDDQGRVVGWNEWIAAHEPRSQGIRPSAGQSARYFLLCGDTRFPTAIDDSLQRGQLKHPDAFFEPAAAAARRRRAEPAAQYRRAPALFGWLNYCLLQISDVTVSVSRERVLRDRQNARYHAIVDSAPDAIITTGLDRTIHWVNGAAERVFGYAATELLGQSIDILLNEPQDSGSWVRGRRPYEHKAAEAQISGRRKDGTLAHFEVSFGRWQADDRVFVTTIWRDVTERIAAENARRESESRYRSLSGSRAAIGLDIRVRTEGAITSIRNGRPTPARRPKSILAGAG